MPTLLLDDTPVLFTVLRAVRRKRTISLIMKPTGELVIRTPWLTRASAIEEFIYKHKAWILKKIASRLCQPQPLQHQFIAGEYFLYLGNEYRLQLSYGITKNCNFRHENNELHITLSHSSQPQEHPQQVATILKNGYYQQAQLQFIERMRIWEQCLAVKAQQLKISRARTRWGSCSAQNIIRLNWRLIMLPLSLIDYVVAHELCHIVHKNHSPAFWRLLDSVMPDYVTRRQALRKFEENILRAF